MPLAISITTAAPTAAEIKPARSSPISINTSEMMFL
nr:MAG TPA: hypothetical protein [Caudoviricetes sp.]